MPGSRKTDLISGAVVLSAFTIFAYLLTYLWQLSYCLEFDIPWQFISLNPAALVVAALGLFLYAGIIYLLALMVTLPFVGVGLLIKKLALYIWPDLSTTVSRQPDKDQGLLGQYFRTARILSYRVALPQFVTCVLVCVVYSLKSAILLGGLVLYMDLTVIGLCHFEWPRLQPIGRFVLNRVHLLAHFTFFVILAWGFGQWLAKTKDTYLVPTGAPNTVVLVIFGDNAISAPFSPCTNVVEQKFKLLKLDSVELEWKKIGRLHPATVANNTEDSPCRRPVPGATR